MRRLLCALCAFALLLAGTRARAEEIVLTEGSDRWSAQTFAMDTLIQATIYAPELTREEVLEVMGNLSRLERLLSVTEPNSEISALNRAEGEAVQLSEETLLLLQTAAEVSKETGGAFDVTAYPLVKAWGFTQVEYRVPDGEELRGLLEQVGYERLVFSEGAVRAEGQTQVDLGGIAKGYAGDVLTRALRERGVKSALLSLGGNIAVIGGKPDGSAWKIGVRDPQNTEENLGYVEVKDANVVTSGGYERYFEDEDGNLWHHIIDPATGYPARSGLLSATVIGENGAVCDALSTALFVMGPEKAADYLAGRTDVEAILVCEDGRLLLTEGLKECFTPLGSAGGRTTEWICRREDA